MAEISRTTFEQVRNVNTNTGQQYEAISNNTINPLYQPSVLKQMQEYPNNLAGQNLTHNLGNPYTTQSYNPTFQSYANQFNPNPHRTNLYTSNQQPQPNQYNQNQPLCPTQYNPNPQPTSANLPLVTRIRNTYPRSVPVINVHPSSFPQPQATINQSANSFNNKEFQTANEIYMKDQNSAEKKEEMLDVSSENTGDKHTSANNPKVPPPRRKRKLFNPNEMILWI